MAVLCKHLSPDVCRRHGPGAINGQGLQGLLSAYFYGRSTALCSQDTHKAIKVPGISLQMIQVIMLRIQLCALDEAPRNMNFPLDKLKMIDYTISIFLSIYLSTYLSIYLYVCMYIYIYALPAHTHAAATYYMKCRLLYRTAARRNGLLYSFFLTKTTLKHCQRILYNKHRKQLTNKNYRTTLYKTKLIKGNHGILFPKKLKILFY